MVKNNPILPETEEASLYNNLERMSIEEILHSINTEDQKVPLIIKNDIIPKLKLFIPQVVDKMKNGGRLFYIGAGTSGRLGVLDASEIPPTYGYSKNKIIGIIAGGNKALRESVEGAEDSNNQGWKDLSKFSPTPQDVIIGIAASGNTPYVVSTLAKCKKENILTAIITSNPKAEVVRLVDFSFITELGPEFITGSTRMKSGTAQKLILNMISTTLMIQLGRVVNNEMSHMKILNQKLRNRAIRMISKQFGISEEKSKKLLKNSKKMNVVIKKIKKKGSHS